MVTTTTTITQDENRFLPKKIPKKKFSRRRTHFYECFKFNECRGKAQHNKNYKGKIIVALSKKWIRDHKQQISDTTIHHDIIVKPIFKIGVIPLNKPLWPPISYLIHQGKNYL
jgi:hypothetical protein